jgi:hypothetical protein
MKSSLTKKGNLKVTKSRGLTLSKAKKRAWTVFSKYIRLSHSDSSYCSMCYTCGVVKAWNDLQSGHGIPGRNNAILFEERVVRPQCVGCNVFGRGQYQIFTRKLIDELGLEQYDEIVSQARVPVKYKVADYLAIEEKYREKLTQFV